jgi:hypothetical protein
MKNKLIICIFFLLGLVLALIIKYLFKINDTVAIIGTVVALGGLSFTIWQTMLTLDSGQENKLSKTKDEILKEVDEIRDYSNKRDFYHEQQLGLLNQYISEMRAHLDNHQRIFGHPDLVKELLAVKDQVSDLRAQVAVIGRQGEIILKLERLQGEVSKLSADSPH